MVSNVLFLEPISPMLMLWSSERLITGPCCMTGKKQETACVLSQRQLEARNVRPMRKLAPHECAVAIERQMSRGNGHLI